MAQGFLIGENLLGQIKDTVKRVQGEPLGGHFTKIETRFEGGPPAAAGGAVRMVAFTGAWPIGGAKTCTVKNSTAELEVKNYFHQIGANCGQRDAAVAKIGSEWVLLVAQCG
jgi:hypothetical protein